jgi:hypothetical protein
VRRTTFQEKVEEETENPLAHWPNLLVHKTSTIQQVVWVQTIDSNSYLACGGPVAAGFGGRQLESRRAIYYFRFGGAPDWSDAPA